MMALQINLPVWASKGELAKLKTALLDFWAWVASVVQWPLSQLDAETCTVQALYLLAWQRQVAPLPGEPIALLRRRVKYAFVNAQDAGSTAGFKRIFQRLEIGYISISERVPGQDWDVVVVELTDQELAGNIALLQQLVNHYGRLCRRYQLQVSNVAEIGLAGFEFSNDFTTYSASIED